DAGFGTRPAAHKADGFSLQADAEDFADPLEILVDRIPPIVVGAKLAIPAARLFLGGIREFGELIDGGADDFRHRRPPRSAQRPAILACWSILLGLVARKPRDALHEVEDAFGR